MPLVALAADKGAPGVTTATVALGAVWPRPVLVAECDPAGGDLACRLPSESGTTLDSTRGLLSLAATARRGLHGEQVFAHRQRLAGGLDVLVGLTVAEQASGLSWLWGPLGRALATLPDVDVLADCGRLGADGPFYDLLAEASVVALLTRASLEEVVRLRERVTALAAALERRRARPRLGVVVVADPRDFRGAMTETGRILTEAQLPAEVLGGLAIDPKGADLLRGAWGGRLDRSLLIRSARELAAGLARQLVPATA